MARLLRHIGIFWRFPRQDKRLFVLAWWNLLLVHWRLRGQPYQEVLDWASRVPGNPGPATSRPDALAVRDIVAKAARYHLFELTCLRQALAACRLLSRQGVPCEIKLGVRREQGQIMAHAWLRVDGRDLPILGSGEKDFSELQQLER